MQLSLRFLPLVVAVVAASIVAADAAPFRAQTKAVESVPPAQTLYISEFNSRTISTVGCPEGGSPGVFVTGGDMLAFPDGMAFDAAGNLFVTVYAPPSYGAVSRVTPDGVVSTYAIGGSIYNPTGLVSDSAGNLYVANQDTATISKVRPGGGPSAISIYASGGGLNKPDGIVLDSAGNLYVANLNNTISKITPNSGGDTGTVSVWVSGNGLLSPSGLAFDPAGNLYVSNGDNRILCLTPQPQGPPVVSVFADNRNGTLHSPSGIAFDAAGNLYVANPDNSTISKVTPDGADSVFASGGSLSRPAFVIFPTSPNTPAAPTITGISQDTGVPGDGITRSATLVISGTAERASTVKVYLGGSPIGTATADSMTGQWSFDYTSVVLPDRAYLLTASAQNASGYVSAASVPFRVIVDTVPPAVTISAPVYNTGTNTIAFTVTFAGADTISLAPGNVALQTTGSASATGIQVSSGGDAASRTVTLSGLSGSGTLAISLSAGTAADLAGNLAPATGPSATAIVPVSYGAWAAGYGLSGANAAFDADPDGDGISNGLEFALGLSPLVVNTAASGLPTFRLNGGRLELSYHKARSDVGYQVQSSTDLQNWTASDVDQGGAGSDVTAFTPAPTGSGARKFLRLVVTLP